MILNENALNLMESCFNRIQSWRSISSYKKIHKMSEKQAVKEMEAAGFKLRKNIENLPWQHCMVFVKK